MRRAILLVALLVQACGASRTGTKSSPPEDVNTVAASYWAMRLLRYPTEATFYGERRYDADLPDLSKEAKAQWDDGLRSLRLRLSHAMAGSAEEQLTKEVLATLLDDELAADICQRELWDVDQLAGYQSSLTELGTYQRIDSEKAAAAYVERLAKMSALFDQHIDNLSRGLAEGYTAPKIVVGRVLTQLDAMLAQAPESSPFVEAVGRASLSESEKERLRAEVVTVVRTGVVPAWTRYRDFLRDIYLARARAEVGVSHNPDGARCYIALIHHHTGSSQSPAAIFALGSQELARLEERMNDIAKQEGARDRDEYRKRLAADPASYLHSAEALIAHNKALVARAFAALPRAFSVLPKEPPGVRAIESFRDEAAPAAYYYPAANDGSRPAYYYVNTRNPATRPLYNMEALAYHEAVPGHHLQIARAQELKGLPEVRRHADFTAFVEGWALYAELLADELGLYSGPSTRFGMLNYQAWRAARLVVDTGMHALGWTREQAIEFMRAHVDLPTSEIENEIDRYIIWPGQALAYMLGRMEIMALREEARAAMGSGFDQKAFHEQVLSRGPLPLPVLRAQVVEWLSSPPR